MQINKTWIDATYAEAFSMRYTRLIVTGADRHWLNAAINSVCGYGTSVIGCDAEVGLEGVLDENASPDGRVGASILVFGFTAEAVSKAVVNRCGQCLMTCPGSAVFNGLPEAENQVDLGAKLRYFGDGFQKSKMVSERIWRIPVMDGEFLVSETAGIEKGVAGGNFILQADNESNGLAAARLAIDSIQKLPGCITPFPGGAVRSGSKVGSKYKALPASTNEAFCPTLRGRVDSQLVAGANWATEIVIDGRSEEIVAGAMIAGIKAACQGQLLAVSAGNYGGQLGKFHFHLQQLLAGVTEA